MQQVRNVNAHFSNLPQNKNIGEKISSPLSHKNATVVAVWTVRGSCFFSNKILFLKNKKYENQTFLLAKYFGRAAKQRGHLAVMQHLSPTIILLDSLHLASLRTSCAVRGCNKSSNATILAHFFSASHRWPFSR